jgi:inosine-uridine nucleoside N-ribohydrolase
MKSSVFFFFLMIFFVASFWNVLLAQDGQKTPKPKVILDADLDSDVDDAGALAMLLNLHKAGTIELIGVIVTSDDPFAPVCASAIHQFYGLPYIPVGFLKGQETLKNHSRYTRQIAEEYPAGIQSHEEAADAVALYRKLLAEADDKSVTIVTIGHLTSFSRLLQSAPDSISSLDGNRLTHKKTDKWLCMGGQYPSGKEANFYRPDPLSTVYCVNHWEKEIVFCGWEVGNLVITGDLKLKNMLGLKHPVYRAYELYNNFAGRPSWDQLAVYLLLDQFSDYFSTVAGRCVVDPDGVNRWENNPEGLHWYIVLGPVPAGEKVSAHINNLMAGNVGEN